jgi:hypothetical protein
MDDNVPKVDQEPLVIIGKRAPAEPLEPQSGAFVVDKAQKAAKMGRARRRGYNEPIGPARLEGYIENYDVAAIVVGKQGGQCECRFPAIWSNICH